MLDPNRSGWLHQSQAIIRAITCLSGDTWSSARCCKSSLLNRNSKVLPSCIRCIYHSIWQIFQTLFFSYKINVIQGSAIYICIFHFSCSCPLVLFAVFVSQVFCCWFAVFISLVVFFVAGLQFSSLRLFVAGLQFSSLGSLDEKWLSELSASMQAGSTFEKEPLGHGATQFIWPTVEDIRCSLEVLECNKHRTHPSSSSTSAAWITTHAFKSFDNAAGLCCRQCSSKSTKEAVFTRFFPNS